MKYRHEWKHEISFFDATRLRERLSVLTKGDAHARDGKYEVRSLYFDTFDDRALREKQDGVSPREKFRIRYYNGDLSFIKLEKKSKINSLCLKESERIDEETVRAILRGDYDALREASAVNPLLTEFYCKVVGGLRPRTVVDYTREPFVYAPGNVRVTLDYDIRAGICAAEFLNRDCITVPLAGFPIILEVKWDEFLPDVIKDAVGLPCCRVISFSK